MNSEPVVAVLPLSESFGAVWPELVTSAGGRLLLLAEREPAASPEPCAVVIGAAGAEGSVADAVAALGVEQERIAVVGAAEDHRLAVGALHSGAGDYFALPADLEALRAWVSGHCGRWRAMQRADALARAAAKAYDFSALIGTSAGLRAAVERAAKVIPRPDTTVLITGETGTGKELIAQAVHYNGPRAAQPFVEVNCAALPPALLEAELFGYEKGAFTDARAAKPGLFEAADGGTLFLDEIGDLKLDLQVKLLRVLEDRQVRRVGGLRSRLVDVRIVAATSVDLPQAVREGSFRSDLFYRLGVLPIHLPPLRERGPDVLLLAEHFVAHFARVHGQPVPRLDGDARDALLAYAWPGNVRELRNAIERAVLLGDGALRVTDLFTPTAPPPAAGTGPLPFPATLDDIERAAAAAMVARHGGNKSTAAAALGVSRSRLYRLLEDA